VTERSVAARTSTARPAVAGTASQAARRQRILDAALTLLDDRPYDQVQIRDVAEEAGVALGTLYRYFPSKEQLFAHALVEWSSRFDASRRGRGPAPVGDGDRLVAVLRRAVRAFERHPHFFRLIAVLEVIADPAVAEPFAEYSNGFRRELLAAMPSTDPSDAEVIATMTSAMIGSLLRAWSLGTVSMRSVYEQVDRSVRLLFEA